MAQGKLILVNGPTGSGKGTLVAYIRSVYPQIGFSVSCTTRSPRPNEVEGVNYYFVSEEEFLKRIEEEKFLEWAKYGKNYYGTLKSEVLPRLEKGEVIALEIEIQGARQIVESTPKDQLLSIYVDAGSWDALEKRILARAPISPDDLDERKKSYAYQAEFKNEADIVIQNPDGGLEMAKKEMEEAVSKLFK
jgi:guanylate kinase